MATRVLNASSLARDLGRWQPEVEDASGRRRTSRPTYRALADGIRLLIHDGRIPLGVGLPSERDLSAALDLSRTTITSSYAVLREEGYLISKQGARSTVALPTKAEANRPAVQSRNTSGPIIDMSHAAMAAPTEAMMAAYQSAMHALPAYLSNHGVEPVGIAVLREAVARRFVERGLPTTAGQIMVTSGAQQALRLLLGTLISPGDRVLIDHPTYPNALEALRRIGAGPVPVPIRPVGDPWDLDGIRSAARQTASKVAYMIPDFHNPTGRCLDDGGRSELARIARETSMTMIVDETMVDLWLVRASVRHRYRDDRVGVQVVLGWSADRLDTRQSGADQPSCRFASGARSGNLGDGSACRRLPARGCRRDPRHQARRAT